MLLRLEVPIRRQLTSRRPVAPVAEDVVGLHQLVDLARALVDDGALAVAVEAADRAFVGIAVAAMNLDRVARGPLGGILGEPFGQAGLAGVAPAVVLQPSRSQ